MSATATAIALAGIGPTYLNNGASNRLLNRFLAAPADAGILEKPETVRAAHRQLAATPLSAEGYYVLALAAERAEEIDRSEHLMTQAVRLHPRMITARTWLLQRYLASGREAAALQQIAVILRLNRNLGLSMTAILKELARHQRLRPLIARQFANTPYIMSLVQEARGDGLDAAAKLELLQGTDLRKLPDGIRSAQSAVAADLLQQGRYGEAREIWWTILGARRPADAIFDPDFSGLEAAPPFAWELTRSASVTAEYVQSGLPDPVTALKVTTFGELPQTLAKQQLVLPQGTYRLRFLSRLSNGSSGAPPFHWRIRCVSGDAVAELPIEAEANWKTMERSFVVPAACPSQMLELASRGGTEGRSPDLFLTSVRIGR